MEFARHFTHEWIDAWNSHELANILSHDSDDFHRSSPLIVQFTGNTSGTLKGKTQVAACWQTALEHMPDLHFELLEVFTGVDSITILYNSVLARRATEVLFLNNHSKVYKALAHYNARER
jgi:ketosteroid isomerase-like protein